MAILLIGNALFFLFPLIYAFVNTYPEGNMWSENGPGAILWLYIFILPISLIVQVVLIILKVKFAISNS